MIHFHAGREIPAVYKAESIHLALMLISIPSEKRKERILLRAARSPLAVNRLIALIQRPPVHIPLIRPGTGEMQHFVLRIVEIQAHARRLKQLDRLPVQVNEFD
ncbi:hypothetical protein D3C71_1696480 [compost metagenome]